ncbi:MAG: VOC family protein, partial [Streptosporangiaceae bacterium]
YDVVAVTDAIAAVRPQWLPTAQAVWAQYLGVLASTQEVTGWLTAAARPRATRLHHLLLEVADLDRSLDFYQNVLGFTIRKREPFRDGRDLVVTDQGLGLVARVGAAPASGGLEHLCFGARGVDELAERARTAGHPIVRGPGPGPYGHTVYIEDPDGNHIELAELETP